MEENLRFIHKSRAVKAAVLLSWSVFFCVLLVSGIYTRYLAPVSGAWFTGAGALMFLLLGCSLLADCTEKHEHTDQCRNGGIPCSYRHRLRAVHLKPALIWALPLLMVLVFPHERGLSATMAGISPDEPAGTAARFRGERTVINGAPEYLITEIPGAADSLPETVTVRGMVYRGALEPPRFHLVRFHITCCAADARPVSLTVDPSAVQGFTADFLENNRWAAVTGTAVKENGITVFRAVSLEYIDPPENEYLY
jgi:uncharacterized repeat protein (TIGR03943 family)